MHSLSECLSLFWSVYPAHCQFTQLHFGTPGCQFVENTAYFISVMEATKEGALVAVGVIDLATWVCVKYGWKKTLRYFEFGLQYLVQLGHSNVNPTCSTFKQTKHLLQLTHIYNWTPQGHRYGFRTPWTHGPPVGGGWWMLSSSVHIEFRVPLKNHVPGESPSIEIVFPP